MYHRPWVICAQPSVHRIKFRFGLLCLITLMVCGDIHSNPGPIRNPCSVCSRSVRSTDKSLLCDGCDLWTHCKCASVSPAMYGQYQLLDYFDWSCPRCLASQLPFVDCSTLNSSTSSDSLLVDSSYLDSTSSDSVVNLFMKTSGKLVNICLINAMSLLSCIEDVFALMIKQKIHLVAITETWLDEFVGDSEVCLTGYTIMRNDRNRRGGGVAILVSNRLGHRV